ncbi:matrixin family metalloprotease [Peribacillus sp. TH24]|uniref:matrixin family metalloprotease n=1 Tax=Peribacillus sp. TH24 TaxID=2798483 RepID=UPI001914D14D|nr:matrixin family metalloprotease [Peribacillus sp. TH24]MBK5447090.1 matrixin family metalloprotease [Peribacillus sp. TH24]MBK5447103.1 matrixin family metalloprotease [Peribacillus sp. TH24]
MKKRKMFFALAVPVMSLGIFANMGIESAHAYKLLSTEVAKKISPAKDAYYWIDPAFLDYSGKTTEVKESVLRWNSTPEIQFTKKATTPGGADIKIEYLNSYSGDTYGRYVSGSAGSIIIYKAWRDLNEKQERETIVHEVGHALGLAHTQSENNSISVMRQYGFNNKDYPLSDDKAGIAKRY